MGKKRSLSVGASSVVFELEELEKFDEFDKPEEFEEFEEVKPPAAGWSNALLLQIGSGAGTGVVMIVLLPSVALLSVPLLDELVKLALSSRRVPLLYVTLVTLYSYS
eukprot:1623618-Rhodomonas_salina.2